MKTVFLNTHSILNSGDMGIVLAQVRIIRRLFPAAEITLTSRTPHLDRRFYSDWDLEVLPPLIPAPSVFESRGEKIKEVCMFFLGRPAQRRLSEALREADFVISSGGGCFYSHRKMMPGPMLLQNLAHVRLAQQLGKPVLFFPQSFGPVFSSLGRRWLRGILSHELTRRIFVREGRSLAYVEELLGPGAVGSELVLCPDLAFTLDPPSPSGVMEEFPDLARPVVALTLRPWEFPYTRGRRRKNAQKTGYLDAVEQVCRYIYREKGGSLLVFPQTRGPGAFENDRIISHQLHARLKPLIPDQNMCFLDPPDVLPPDRIMRILSQADLLIATRFHSAIYALLVHTPVLSLAYQPKASGMMEMLGLEASTLDIANLTPGTIIDAMESILSDRSGFVEKASAGIRAMKLSAEECVRAGLSPFLETTRP
jgi:colanic acid/amylovoran biosynthesis protein